MHLRHRLAAPLAVAALALSSMAAGDPATTPNGADDAVVIAVVDNGFAAYHDDFRADLMPQHLDDDPANDLPLDEDPSTWLPGFDREAFEVFEPVHVTLPPRDEPAHMEALYAEDADEWSYAMASSRAEVNGVWLPGTKIIAGLSFGGGGTFAVPEGASHGVGSSSVSAGNVHGTCPECLLVLIRFSGRDAGEAAVEWALSQPWIDVVTNSFGYSTGLRDQVYDGSDTEHQRRAVERGLGLFWSAGNGHANAFAVPASTLTSSQKGPDWQVTVGAVTPQGASYTGHNKPVDLAAPGQDYPSAPSSGSGHRTDGEGRFSGTSNATPVTAGIYAKALHEARKALAGPSRVQDAGVIAVGEPVACGAVRPDCELGDGELTYLELRTRLFEGAVHSPQGYASSILTPAVATPRLSWEQEFLNEGHGIYLGRVGDHEEELARIVEPMLGTAPTLERPDGEVEWMVVDSYCRQLLWGGWDLGYWRQGDAVPGADPAWPTRTAYLDGCEAYAQRG